MQAELTASGVLVLTPESSTEAYALKVFADLNYVGKMDVVKNTQGFWKGPCLKVKGEWPVVRRMGEL